MQSKYLRKKFYKANISTKRTFALHQWFPFCRDFTAFPVFPLTGLGCMSKFLVNVTFATISILRNFAKPPVFIFFYSEQLELLLMGFTIIWNFFISLYLCKSHQVNNLEQHRSFSWQVNSLHTCARHFGIAFIRFMYNSFLEQLFSIIITNLSSSS